MILTNSTRGIIFEDQSIQGTLKQLYTELKSELNSMELSSNEFFYYNFHEDNKPFMKKIKQIRNYFLGLFLAFSDSIIQRIDCEENKEKDELVFKVQVKEGVEINDNFFDIISIYNN